MVRSVDWERVEALYRAGTASVREIAAEFGVSHTAINKRAKREEWTRDLQAMIRAKADAKVSRALVSAEVSATAAETEATRVEVEAEVQARIRLAHRKDIGRSRELAVKLLAELEAQTDNGELFEQLYELLNDPEGEDSSAAARERDRKRREAFERAMSLGGRTKTMKDLADTLKTLIALEREAYGVASAKPEEPSAPGAQPTNAAAREIAYALHLGLKNAANDSQTPRQAAS